MSKRNCALLCAALFLAGTGSVNAIEYGEVVQKDGKWMFKNTEDSVFKLMRDTGWITNERYFQVLERTGQN